MATETKRLLTYEDYAALPDEGRRYELIDGVLYVTPSPTTDHQGIAGLIYFALMAYLNTHPIGRVFIAPLDVVLGPGKHNTFQPDVIFIANERQHIITPENIQGAPDLVVEVLSKSTEERDLGPKKRAYQENGVTEYWIVWQTLPRIEVYRLKADGKYGDPHLLEAEDILTTPLLPDFSLEVAGLYREIPPAEQPS